MKSINWATALTAVVGLLIYDAIIGFGAHASSADLAKVNKSSIQRTAALDNLSLARHELAQIESKERHELSEKGSRERDNAARARSRAAENELRRRLDAHLEKAAEESKIQATFRGEMSAVMKILLERYNPKVGTNERGTPSEAASQETSGRQIPTPRGKS